MLAYLGLTVLFQTAQIWVAPSIITARWGPYKEFVYSVFSSTWLDATPQSPSAVWIKVVYVVLVASCFLIYLRAARHAYRSSVAPMKNSRKTLLLILMVAGVSLALLLLGRAMLATDVYSYVWYGRIPALEGGNPFLDRPNAYMDADAEGWFDWEVWLGTLPSVYGPVWIWLSAGITYLADAVAGKELVAHVLGHRLIADVAHLINIVLIWRVAAAYGKRYVEGASPEETDRKRAALQLGATLAYAWNPLCLIEFGLSGHNDSIMITFLLIAVWFLVENRWGWAAFALAVASLVKALALLFLPFLLIWVWHWTIKSGKAAGASGIAPGRKALMRAGAATAIIVASWVAAMWPYGGPMSLIWALSVNPATTAQKNSIAGVILVGIPATLYSMGLLVSETSTNREVIIGDLYRAWYGVVRTTLQALAGLLLLATCWGAWQSARKEPHHAMQWWGWAMIVYLTVGSAWFWPWYVSWLFVPVALVGPGRLWNAAQILAVSAMAVYVGFPAVAGWELWENYVGVVLVVPLAIYLLLSWLRAKWTESRVRVTL